MGYDGKSFAKDPVAAIKQVMAGIVCEDLSNVLAQMSCTLDLIELSLSDDRVLQSSMPLWRDMLGRWRNSLFHQSTSLTYLLDSLKSDVGTLGSAADKAAGRDSMTRRLSRLDKKLERTRARIEAAFQALMSTMSIVESERAIQETEAVSKLTYLAFFFIPLSLVAGVFGMNVIVSPPNFLDLGICVDVVPKEFSNKLTWWMWFSVSIGATAFTYLALYWRELFRALGRLPKLIKSMSVRGLSRMAFQWLRILVVLLDGKFSTYLSDSPRNSSSDSNSRLFSIEDQPTPVLGSRGSRSMVLLSIVGLFSHHYGTFCSRCIDVRPQHNCCSTSLLGMN